MPPQPAVKAAVDSAAAALSAAGYEVIPLDPPDLDELAERWRILLGTETKAGMMDIVQAMGSPEVNQAISWMLGDVSDVDLAGYANILGERTRHLRSWQMFMDDTPLVLSPVSQEIPVLAGDDIASKERMLELLQVQTMLVVGNYLATKIEQRTERCHNM